MDFAAVLDMIEDLKRGASLDPKTVLSIIDHSKQALGPLPNVVQLPGPSATRRVTVVGDLHGSFADLDAILSHCGPPGPDHLMIFNGDFVDRGAYGLEVLMVLLAFKAAVPEYVHLNRGNHEDRMLASVYGFKNECIAKTNEYTFQRICKVFALIPLAAVVEDVGFVVHGGLTSQENCTIDDINSIPRRKWDTVSQAGVTLESLPPAEREQFKLMKDLLWSDIDARLFGTLESPRGAGCIFGPLVAKQFLEKIKLPLMVRSHNAVQEGIESIDCKGGTRCYTVFSASNYVNSGNNGSVITFSCGPDGKLQSEPYTYYTPYDGIQPCKQEGRPIHAQASLLSVLTQHEETSAAFIAYFDGNADGGISHPEWMKGCAELNSNLPHEEQIDAERFFEILDRDGDGEISSQEILDYLKVAGEVEQRSIFKRKRKMAKANRKGDGGSSVDLQSI